MPASIEVDRGELCDDLAVPYVAMVYSTENDAGEWVRHAEYPELPGAHGEAATADEALELLEVARARIIVEMRRTGQAPPRPRPPLRSGASGLSPWTAEQLADLVLADDPVTRPRGDRGVVDG